jgi:hypothetical protein
VEGMVWKYAFCCCSLCIFYFFFLRLLERVEGFDISLIVPRPSLFIFGVAPLGLCLTMQARLLPFCPYSIPWRWASALSLVLHYYK